MGIFVAVKTITIKESVYDKLAGLKGNGESFSDLFERLAEKAKPDIMKYAGIISDDEAERIRKSMLEGRRSFNRDAERRRKLVAKMIGRG